MTHFVPYQPFVCVDLFNAFTNGHFILLNIHFPSSLKKERIKKLLADFQKFYRKLSENTKWKFLEINLSKKTDRRLLALVLKTRLPQIKKWLREYK
jgi:hypothetical protein